MSKLCNLARMTTATTGTGTITLGVPVSGFLSFAGAGVSDGDVVSYGITDGSNSEVGTGTFSATGTTLTRSVTRSTNGNAAINLSGSAQVFITARAEDIVTPAATEAQAETGTDNTTVMTPQAVSQAILANALGFKNIAGRNGGLEVWQRGTPVSVPASTLAYTADGWFLSTGANQASTVSQGSGLTSGSTASARVQRNSGQTGTTSTRFAFPLDTDEVRRMAGRSVLLQFAAQAGANWSPTSGTLSYSLSVGPVGAARDTGGGYAGGSSPINSSVNLTPGGGAIVFNSAIAQIPAGSTAAQINFDWTPIGTAGANDWLAIDDVDLRVVPPGLSAAKPTFERTDYSFDLQRRLRHFWKPIGNGPIVRAANATGFFYQWIQWHVQMRATPTVTIGGSVVTNNANTVQVSNVNQEGGEFNANATASGAFVFFAGITVSAEI